MTHLTEETFCPSSDYKIMTKDRREIWTVMHSTPTYANGVRDGPWVVAQNTTEHKQMEE